MQYSTLQYGILHSSPPRQEHSKLFWSISFLDKFYGPQNLVPTVSDDIGAPRFSTVAAGQGYSLVPCPPLPQGSSTVLRYIWAHTVKICSLWGDVKLYVSNSFEGVTSLPPWQPNSDYVGICSPLMDLETAHPTSLSYNTVSFPDRSPQEVQDNRVDWFPWLGVQVTYHAIHCVLNHPFLYSAMASKQRLGSNTFWRALSERALRHSTWVSRLIRMAVEKGLKLADPFFAQAAAIAGSIQLYWIRADDAGLRASTLTNLHICTTLITDMSEHLPVCRSIVSHSSHHIHLSNADPVARQGECLVRVR